MVTPPPSTPPINIPDPVTNITAFLKVSWIIGDIENTIFWGMDWAFYGIGLFISSFFNFIQVLVSNLFIYLANLLYFLGPFSAPMWLVLCIGVLGMISLLFDQVISWIPK